MQRIVLIFLGHLDAKPDASVFLGKSPERQWSFKVQSEKHERIWDAKQQKGRLGQFQDCVSKVPYVVPQEQVAVQGVWIRWRSQHGVQHDALCDV